MIKSLKDLLDKFSRFTNSLVYDGGICKRLYIENINKDLNQWEKIVNFKIITNDISIEGGELTPSMKVCRNVIEKKYEHIINSMY